MAGIRIVIDSAADLPRDIAEEFDIRVIPLDVRLGAWGPDEMRALDPAEFWRRCAITSVLPETSAPSPGAFAESFAQAADDGCTGVVCLTISSELSSTYQAACAGADEVHERIDVRVVDTLSLTLGEAMVAFEAVRVATSTNSLDAAEDAARRAIPAIHVLAALDTLENARKGGRVGTAKTLMSSLLQIKPIIDFRRGLAVVESRQRTRAGSLQYLVAQLKRAGKLKALGVAHAAAPDLEMFLDMLAEIYPRDQILTSYIGSVTGAHAGPRCIAICYQLAETAGG
jgi:DegV family protein with EDD domain